MFIIHFIIRSIIAIDLGMFWIFRKVCRFVQEWTGITTFALARACSVSCVLCSVILLFFALFGQMEMPARTTFLGTAFLGQFGGIRSLALVRYVERRHTVSTENPLKYDFSCAIVRFWALFCACMVSYSMAQDAPQQPPRTWETVLCSDIVALVLWIAVMFVYFVSINPDPLGPSRISRMIRRLFPQSA